MHRTLTIALAATAVVAAAVPAVSMAKAPEVSAATKPAVTAKTSPSTLKWAPCPADVAQLVPIECSSLRVPLDYSKPNGRQIEIAISRLASKEPAQRRGVLMTNPGGPGFGGLDFPATLGAYLPKDVLNAYDVIGMDPRGLGRSTPITCNFTKEQQARGGFGKFAHTLSDVTQEAKYARSVAKQCAASKTAWMMPYVTTANTARDLDRVRAALGESTASYFGGSYGSYLGAVYTTLFPKTTDRVVIDSVLGPDGYDEQAMRATGRGMEDRFPDVAKYIAAHPEYKLGTTTRQVRAKFFQLAKKVRAAGSIQGIDETTFRTMTFEYSYADATLDKVAVLWRAIDTNTPLEQKPKADADNGMAVRLGVICGDSRWPTSVREYQRNVLVDRIKYPMLGGASANIQPCAFWANKPIEPPVKITDRGPSNLLLVQYERDPGTALAGAQKMRKALGQRATMVTADGGGHGVYPWTLNTCAKNAATKFLVTGERPAKDLACAAEPKK
ncbi:alpha/beta hydrolase [Kribbella endophytica]